ncbi:MAG TPA: hypothetical protein VNS58_00605 [Puia sp.]|nr:hypothetical protein [Puia sp.]
MYTSYIGKKFLKLYREKYNKSNAYTARQFFDEILFPLFFDDEKHLMHVGNSPFFQKPKESDVIKYGKKSLAQYNNLINAIEIEPPNMAIYVGFAAKDVEGTTSGQLTSIDFKTDAEEMYASWIGEGLGIGVSGGYVMLIDEEKVLFSLFNGWIQYRKYLQQTPHLKDKQIETWNGHWLCHSFQNNFDLNHPMDNFKVEIAEVQGKIAISTQNWSKVIFALSKKYANTTLIAYAYNLSQTNTTLGFINLCLPDIRRLYELRDKIFINQSEVILKDEEIEKLETFFNFRSACKMGTIGLKALEPSKLREYMPRNSMDYAQGKDFKFSDDNSYYIYSLYKLWIIAMLNKTELLQLASGVATALLEFENQPNNRGKKDLVTLSEEVKEASNLRVFIEKLTAVLDKKPENAQTFRSVVEQTLKMPSDNFPLFSTLIRFEYTYQKSKN